ncbi:MAG: type III secretion system chaperone [Succinimonas sp.]|nr:type III secretion system chaperone [Succinimonas sp.]
MEGIELIKFFGQSIGLELELDESNSCSFAADEFTVTFTDLPEFRAVALICDLGEPRVDNNEKLYKAMLEANYVFNSTYGATLCLNGESGHCAINKVLPCDILDNDKFMAEVEQFVNIGEFWNNVVRGYAEAADQESPGEDAAADAGSFDAANFMPV